MVLVAVAQGQTEATHQRHLAATAVAVSHQASPELRQRVAAAVVVVVVTILRAQVVVVAAAMARGLTDHLSMAAPEQ
jgi:hypothetical protein